MQPGKNTLTPTIKAKRGSTWQPAKRWSDSRIVSNMEIEGKNNHQAGCIHRVTTHEFGYFDGGRHWKHSFLDRTSV